MILQNRQKGDLMTHIDNISEEARERIQALIKDLEMISDERKDLEAAEKDLREQLETEMKEFELDYIDNGTVEVKYISAKVRQRVDSERLEQDYPDLYARYLIKSEVKSHIVMRKLK